MKVLGNAISNTSVYTNVERITYLNKPKNKRLSGLDHFDINSCILFVLIMLQS